MSRAVMELDFFAVEKHTTSSNAKLQKFLDRRRSFREIQGAISKISPEIIKSVIGTRTPIQRNGDENLFGSSCKTVSIPSTPKEDQPNLSFPPVHAPITRSTAEKIHETAPLTIFYNGTISVFEVSREKAEDIMKLAVEGNSKKLESSKPNLPIPSINKEKLINSLDGDLPIARRKSLQTFLQKRKERLTFSHSFGPGKEKYDAKRNTSSASLSN